jgi:hypothetical protein
VGRKVAGEFFLPEVAGVWWPVAVNGGRRQLSVVELVAAGGGLEKM